MSLTACESAGSYRVASVGSVPDSGSGSASDGSGSGSGSGDTAGSGSGSGSGTGAGGTGGTGSGSAGGTGSSGGSQGTLGGGILVTAGNTVIGAAGKQSALTNATLLPTVGKVSGVVTAVLTRTGQTLVNLGSGRSLILDGTGKLGEIVKIDLGSRSVTGASAGSSLLGVGVLSSPSATGKLAAVNVANAGPLLTVGGTGIGGGVPGTAGVLAPVSSVVNGVVTPGSTTGVLTPATGIVSSVVTPTGSTGLVAGVGGALGVTATPGSTQGSIGVGGVAGGVLGFKKH